MQLYFFLLQFFTKYLDLNNKYLSVKTYLWANLQKPQGVGGIHFFQNVLIWPYYYAFKMYICLSEEVACHPKVFNFKTFWIWSKGGSAFFKIFWNSHGFESHTFFQTYFDLKNRFSSTKSGGLILSFPKMPSWHCLIAIVSLSLSHWLCLIVMSHCHCLIVIVSLTLSHWHCLIDIVSLTFSNWHYLIDIVSSTLSHWHGLIDDVSMTLSYW